MSPRRLALALAVAVLALAASSTGCITGVPYCCAIVMPARYDAGAVVASDRRAPGLHLAAGMSWASGVPDPKPDYDVSAGGLLEVHGEPDPAAPAPTRMTAGDAPGRYVYGGYLEVDRRVAGTRTHRAFVGLRGELVGSTPAGDDEPMTGFGLTARSSWEWFRSGKGPTWSGAVAVGGFVEATARAYTSGALEHAVVAGVSFRLPVKFLPVKRR